MIDFQNQTLDISQLPKFETVEGQHIDRAYLKVLRLFYCLWLIVLFSGLLVTNYFADIPNAVFYIILSALIVFFSIYILETEKGFDNVYHLEGGIEAWANEIDPQVIVY